MEGQVHPQARPFYYSGGPIGVLLIHGFTSSPSEVQWLGKELHKAGYTVSGPLLQGHGTTPPDLQRRKRQEWLRDVTKARDELLQTCREVFLMGLSMGGLLALMAWDHPRVKGIAAMASPIIFRDWKAHWAPWVHWFYPYASKKSERRELDELARQGRYTYDCYPVRAMGQLVRLIDDVKRELPRIDKPLLVFQSSQDDSVREESARYIHHQAGSRQKELHILHNPGHIITMGRDREFVRDRLLAWMSSILEKGD